LNSDESKATLLQAFEGFKATCPSWCKLAEPASAANEEYPTLCGRRVDSLDINTVVYCGSNHRYLLALRTALPAASIWQWTNGQLRDAASSMDAQLRRRRFLVEKVRDAERLGVLVGTLGASKYRQVIDQVTEKIAASGKKCYTLLVGKPNEAKLANFPEIDALVLVACPESSIVDAKAFMQPVVTPLELDLALNANRQAGATATSADFADCLPGGQAYVPFAAKQEADVSLISGKLRRGLVVEEENSTDDPDSFALARQETRVSLLDQNGGGAFLSQRSWRGLEQKLGETPVLKAEKGRTGIAYGYQGEGQ